MKFLLLTKKKKLCSLIFIILVDYKKIFMVQVSFFLTHEPQEMKKGRNLQKRFQRTGVLVCSILFGNICVIYCSNQYSTIFCEKFWYFWMIVVFERSINTLFLTEMVRGWCWHSYTSLNQKLQKVSCYTQCTSWTV